MACFNGLPYIFVFDKIYKVIFFFAFITGERAISFCGEKTLLSEIVKSVK